MALVQPTNLFPSSFRGSGGDVIDASVSNTFSMQLNGSSPCVAYALKIMQNDAESTAVYTINKTSLATPIYPRDHTNTPQRLEIVIPSTSGMTNGYANGYKWNASLYWDNSNYIKSADTFFKTEATPYFTVVDPPSTVTSKSVTLTATYTQANGVPLEWYRWTISDANGNIVADTGEVYSEDIQITVDGLLSGETFSYVVEGQTQSGVPVEGVSDGQGNYSNKGTFTVTYVAPIVSGGVAAKCSPRTGSINVSFPSVRIIEGTGTGSYSYASDLPVSGETSIVLPASAVITFDTVNGEPMNFNDDVTHIYSGQVNGVGGNFPLYIFTEDIDGETVIGELKIGISPQYDTVSYRYNGRIIFTKTFSIELDSCWIVAIMRHDSIVFTLWQYDGGTFPSTSLYPSNVLYPTDDARWVEVGRYSRGV